MGPVSTRRRLLGAVGAAGAVGLTGCTGDAREREATAGSADATVRMTADFAFDPGVVEVDVGDTVTWVNAASPRQSVTAYEDGIPAQSEYFASGGSGREVTARILYPLVGGLNRGDRYSNTFELAGTYRYFSIPSEGRGMTGAVVVTR